MKRPAWWTPRAGRVARALALGVAVSVAVTALSQRKIGAWWQRIVVDAFVYVGGAKPSPEIVLVLIDDEAFRELGERQPLPRRYLAELGEVLLRSGARVVAFDVMFSAPTAPEEDRALLDLARRWEGAGAGRPVFVSRAVPRPGVTPPRYDLLPLFSPELRGLVGYADAPLGGDRVSRLMDPVLPAADGGFVPSFALAVLAAYAGHTPEALVAALRRADRRTGIRLPLRDAAGEGTREETLTLGSLSETQWRIDFAGRAGAFTEFPSGPLVGLARRGERPAADNPFRGKMVLVGASFEESRDVQLTPVGTMRGVEIQAHMVHTLLTRRGLLPPHWLVNLGLLIGACLVASLLSLWRRPLWAGAASLALVGALLWASYGVYLRSGLWLDFVTPLVGMMAYVQGSRLLARRRLRSAFGQFVSPEVVSRIAQDGAALGGEVRTVTVLMSDLRGFTTLSERLPPDRITAMMNEYFTAMVEAIAARRGVVSDFVGDGILAVYGAPAPDPDHAWHAVLTGWEMQAALARLNRRWEAEGRPSLAMGVAVNTGEVYAGNIGSPRRKKYAVMGDTVNTVSRMEGLNRDLGTSILVSGTTLAAVKERAVVRDRGSVPVKGRAQPVELFELVGLRAEAAGRASASP